MLWNTDNLYETVNARMCVFEYMHIVIMVQSSVDHQQMISTQKHLLTISQVNAQSEIINDILS